MGGFLVYIQGSEHDPLGDFAICVSLIEIAQSREQLVSEREPTNDLDQFKQQWQAANASGCKELRLNFLTAQRQDEFLSCLPGLIRKDTKNLVIELGKHFLFDLGLPGSPPVEEPRDVGRLCLILAELPVVSSLKIRGMQIYSGMQMYPRFSQPIELPLQSILPMRPSLECLYLEGVCLDMNLLLGFLRGDHDSNVECSHWKHLELICLGHNETDDDTQVLFKETWTNNFIDFLWNHTACSDIRSVTLNNAMPFEGSPGDLQQHCQPHITTLHNKLVDSAPHIHELKLLDPPKMGSPQPDKKKRDKTDKVPTMDSRASEFMDGWNQIADLELGSMYRLSPREDRQIRCTLAWLYMKKQNDTFQSIIEQAIPKLRFRRERAREQKKQYAGTNCKK